MPAPFQQPSTWITPPNQPPERFSQDQGAQHTPGNPEPIPAALLANLQPWYKNAASIPPERFTADQGYQEDPTQAPFNRSIAYLIRDQLAPWWLNPARIPVPAWEQGVQPSYALANNPAIFSFGMRVHHFEDPWVSPSEIIQHMNNLPGSGSVHFQGRVVGVIPYLTGTIISVESPG